jgi:nicotinate-nucleotide adenylyltransferase
MPEVIAVLGGTFDPIHNGHVSVLQQVGEKLHAAQSWLLVAGNPNLRGRPVSPVEIRMQMAQAVAGENGWKVCDIEARREGPTYTLDTVAELHERYPELAFRFVLGADAARRIRHWHRWPELLAQTSFVLVNRSGVDAITPAEAAALGFDESTTSIFEVDSPPVSATDIRDRVGHGRAISELVPASVAGLIARLGVYRHNADE